MKYLFFLGIFHPMIVVFLFSEYSGAATEQEGLWAWNLLGLIFYPTSLIFDFEPFRQQAVVLILGLGNWVMLYCGYLCIRKAFRLLTNKQNDETGNLSGVLPSSSNRVITGSSSQVSSLKFSQDKGIFPDPVEKNKPLQKREAKNITINKPGFRSQDKAVKGIERKSPLPGARPIEGAPPAHKPLRFKGLLVKNRTHFLVTGIFFAVFSLIFTISIDHLSLRMGEFFGLYSEKIPARVKWVETYAYIDSTGASSDLVTPPAFKPWIYIQYRVNDMDYRRRYRPMGFRRTYTTRWEALEKINQYIPGTRIKIYYNEYSPHSFRMWTEKPPVAGTETETELLSFFFIGISFVFALLFLALATGGYRLSRRGKSS